MGIMDVRLWYVFLCIVVAAYYASGDEDRSTRVHVVYVQFYDKEVRSANNGNALHVIAPTLHQEIEALVNVYKSAHEVIAILTATCTRHTKMLTEADGVELDTFIFTYTDADAVLIPHYVLAQPPVTEAPVEEPASRLGPRDKKTLRRAMLPNEL